jgi:hypothetical protein
MLDTETPYDAELRQGMAEMRRAGNAIPTGAGNLYAAGFLFGVSCGRDLVDQT